MTRPTTQAISPFFIVSNVDQSIAFYCGKLGFETRFQEPDRNPFFAIVGRDGNRLICSADAVNYAFEIQIWNSRGGFKHCTAPELFLNYTL